MTEQKQGKAKMRKCCFRCYLKNGVRMSLGFSGYLSWEEVQTQLKNQLEKFGLLESYPPDKWELVYCELEG